MSQASSSSQKLFVLLRQYLKRQDWRKVSRWGGCLAVIALMWCWSWKLLLATVVGIAMISLSYLAQNRHWQKYWQQHWHKWQHFVTGFNRQVVIAAGTGGLGAFSTYLAVSLWAEAENRWLATGLILQGLTGLVTLSLLVWSLLKDKKNSLEVRCEKLLLNLTHPQPLKRLVAIRQLTRLVKSGRLSSEYYWQAIECYRLMLAESQLSFIRIALLDSLDTLGIKYPSQSPRPPIKIPIELQQTPKQVLDPLL